MKQKMVSIGTCGTQYLVSGDPIVEVIGSTDRGYHTREVEVYYQPLPETSCVAKHTVKEDRERMREGMGREVGGREGMGREGGG